MSGVVVVEYGSEKEWRRTLRQNPKYKMHEIIEALGLRTNRNQGKRGKTTFDSPDVRALVLDIDRVVAKLPHKSEALIIAISTPDSLARELDYILEEHGPRIWGRSGPRLHLLRAGAQRVNAGLYPKDLFYEDEGDRRTIRVLLHWWIGQKASNVIFARERYARKRRDRYDEPVDGFLNEVDDSVETTPTQHLPVTGSEMQDPPQVMQDRVRSISRTISPASESRPISRQSSAPDDHGPTDGVSVPRSEHDPPQMDPRQAASEIGQFASNLSFSGDSEMPDIREDTPAVNIAPPIAPTNEFPGFGNVRIQPTLDMDALHALRAYVYPSEADGVVNEELLLRRLEKAWREIVRASHNRRMESPILFAARDEAFLTWIEIRRTIAGFLRIMERNPRPGGEELRTIANTYRELCRSWQAIGKELEVAWAPKISANELLVQAFIMLAGRNNSVDMIWGPVNALEYNGAIYGQGLELLGQEDQRPKLFYVGD
ncbi:hypothetical protein BCR34DRAFT_168254 [Clohesyomyces aquaticus]|uniref:Uncharacterized protein n=1 Tax=Clohesyomyces aquaticus TaxID=1231657 RepID=A0A1Y1YGV9_9PLEO|nr:hypothetical protein BCR34DRAFT_168254 [Clohesyomyces aquaticus]